MKFAALLPLKMLGWAAAGVALGVGWKVGCYLVEKVAEDPSVKDFLSSLPSIGCSSEEPLWKRRFTKVS